MSKVQGHQAALLITALTRKAAAAVSVGTYRRGKLLLRCGVLGGASAPTEGGEGRVISWRPPAYSLLLLTLPYLTLPYGEDVLPPSAEASNGPNAHPRINRKGYKIPKCNTHLCPYQYLEPSPSLEGAYSLEPTY